MTDLIPHTYRLPAATLDQWRHKCLGIGRHEAERPWFCGDVFLEGKNLIKLEPDTFYTFAQIAFKICAVLPKVGIAHQDWIEWGFVAAAFPPSARVAGVTWAHHRHLAWAELPPEQSAEWLAKAFANEWTVADLRAAMAKPVAGPQLKGFQGASLGLIPRKVATDALRCLRLWQDSHPIERLRPEELKTFLRDFEELYEELGKLKRLFDDLQTNKPIIHRHNTV